MIAHSVATNTVQGSITSESVATDMAINGDGFFVVSQLTGFTDNQPVFSGVMDYTRAGDFQLNANGNLVNGAGYYLMGVPVDPITGNPLGSAPTVLQFNNSFVPAQRDDADSILGEPSCQPAGHAQPEQLHVQPGRRRPDRQLRCGIRAQRGGDRHRHRRRPLQQRRADQRRCLHGEPRHQYDELYRRGIGGVADPGR